MKKLIMALIAVLSFEFSTNAQEKGVQFDQSMNWEQIKSKAKAEGKYIFIDVFATWCVPCETMEKKVYSNGSVGEAVNKSFISVKVQADTGKSDNDHVKSWYAVAKSISTQYRIKAFPTMLFLSPDGKLVHRAVGYKDPEKFIAIIHEATDPLKQLYPQLEQFRLGKLSAKALSVLANKLKESGEEDIAGEIAAKYIDGLSEKEIYTKENLQFIYLYTNSTKDKMFNLFYNNQKKVDAVMEKPYYAQGFVDYLVTKDYIDDPYLIPASTNETVADLDWNKIYKTIAKKFNATYADRNVTGAKARWYEFKQVWPSFISNKIRYIEVYDRPEFKERDMFYYGLNLNNVAWSIFQYSSDPKQLEIALKWAKLITEKYPELPQFIDTYANLLYKVGKKEEAIALEEKAVSLMPGNKEIKESLDKMNANQPTWPSK